MKANQLIFKQTIPISLSEAWTFFSSPLNLAEITPKDMAFKVMSNKEMIQNMYAGMIIMYKVTVAGVPLNWMTEITQVEDQHYFIDEQRFGPYKFWHHQHHFKEVGGGVEMTDMVTYGLSFGFLGNIANKIFVGPKLQQIFEYRKQAIIERFGTKYNQ